MVTFAGGLPTEEFYPSSELQKMVAEIVSSADAHTLFEYSPAEGHALLREQVLKLCASRASMPVTTNSSSSADRSKPSIS